MTHNEQVEARVAKAIEPWIISGGSARSAARAALDAMGPPSHGMRTGKSMVADAMGQGERTVTSVDVLAILKALDAEHYARDGGIASLEEQAERIASCLTPAAAPTVTAEQVEAMADSMHETASLTYRPGFPWSAQRRDRVRRMLAAAGIQVTP